MFYFLNFLYLSSVISCFVYYKKFCTIAKFKPERYNKLIKQIEKKELKTDKNELNIFNADEKSSATFNFVILCFIPILNLFLIYTYITYISFLRKD